MELKLILSLLLAVPGFLLAIVCHEAAHAWVANKLGDPTARMLGRMNLNPLKHIDPWGTILLPLLLLVVSQGRMVFGYARPVPITVQNFKRPKWDSLLTSLAGPLANLLLAMVIIVIAWGLRVAGLLDNPGARIVLEVSMSINLMLGIFNLLPIPPLDGSEVVTAFLPGPLAYKYQRLAPWGFLILMGLFYLGGLNFLGSLTNRVGQLLLMMFGNPFL